MIHIGEIPPTQGLWVGYRLPDGRRVMVTPDEEAANWIKTIFKLNEKIAEAARKQSAHSEPVSSRPRKSYDYASDRRYGVRTTITGMTHEESVFVAQAMRDKAAQYPEWEWEQSWGESVRLQEDDR